MRADTEYTDENPLDIASDEFSSLAHLLMKRCEEATKDMGEFGITIGGHSDGRISLGFGPNMTVRWSVVLREGWTELFLSGEDVCPCCGESIADRETSP